MQSILVTMSKGGVGKTTLSFGLAIEAMQAGKKVLLIDGDDVQKSLSSLLAKRDENSPALAEISGGAIVDALEDPQVQEYDLVIIDGAPRATADIRALVPKMDFILLPVTPSPLDIEASNVILGHVQKASVPFAFTICRADPRRAVVGQIQAVLKAAYNVGPILFERSDWITAVGSGKSPSEWNPGGKAAEEIAEIWKYVNKQINK